MAKILYLEDDLSVAESVVDHLSIQNYSVEWVTSGKETLERLSLYSYDLAILDLTVEDIDGLSVCQTYRAKGGSVPILMLTGRSSVAERVTGF